MSIKKYVEEGVEYYKVYVHIRSKTNRKKRIQKYSYHLKTIAEARREEKKLIIEATFEVSKIDGMGLDWSDVIHMWSVEIKAGYMGKINERTANEYASTAYKWTASWMKRPAASINRADGRDLLKNLERANLSQAYQKRVKNMISKIYNWGIEFRHILGVDKSPFHGLIVNVTEEKIPDILTLEEIKKFLTAAKALSHDWYPIWAFAVLTGMRSGELHALKWSQVDLEKSIILVDSSFDSNTKTLGPTKGRYWRVVPINESLKQLLLELKSGPKETGSEFILPRLRSWDNGDQAIILRTFLKDIGVTPVKFHALRACFATQMLASGVSSPVVMKIGGWKNSKTMDIYLRLAGVETKGATDCLEFVPSSIDFSSNVISLNDHKKS